MPQIKTSSRPTLNTQCVECEELAFVACPHRGQVRTPPSRTNRTGGSTIVLLPSLRASNGEVVVWNPYQHGKNRFPSPSSGHVHLSRAFTATHILSLIERCPRLYLVSCCPSNQHFLELCLGFLRPKGIGARTQIANNI